VKDFHRSVPIQAFQRSPNAGVLDIPHPMALLYLGVDQPIAGGNELGLVVNGQVAILVNGGSQDHADVMLMPRGVVSASSKKGDAEGGAGDDHI